MTRGILRVVLCFDWQVKSYDYFSTVHASFQNASDFNQVLAHLDTVSRAEEDLVGKRCAQWEVSPSDWCEGHVLGC